MTALIATATAIGGFLLGNVLGAWLSIADRLVARRAREGDMAAVVVAYEHWELGNIQIPLQQVGLGEWVGEQEAVLFPMTVTNGSEDKISNVDFGIRWHDGGELQAAHVPALNPGMSHTGSAAESYGAEFEPQDFDGTWLSRLSFYVRFTDQRGDKWENVLNPKANPPWASRRL